MAHYVMVIDLARCYGCQTCAVACKISNNLPKGIWWNRVITVGGNNFETPSGTFPNLKMSYLPINCQHCEDPACVKVCPTGATFKGDNGIVVIDKDACIGCRACMTACPYDARSFNQKKIEYIVEHAVGDGILHEHGVVEKCTFCTQRIAKGENPACMELCPGRARYWGDLEDPSSEVNKVMKDRNYVRLLEEKGTNPSIYYLI